MCDQRLKKVALYPVGKIPAEKSKYVEQDFLNLALLICVKLPRVEQLTFVHDAAGSLFIGLPILSLALSENPEYP